MTKLNHPNIIQLYDSYEEVVQAKDLRVGILTDSQFARAVEQHVPGAETVVVPSTRWYFEEDHDLDALLMSAEAGAAWTVLHPDYQVVIPTRRHLEMPLTPQKVWQAIQQAR